MEKEIKKFLTISLLGLLIVNFTLISGYLVVKSYGQMTLNPGEEYTVNIPFFGSSLSPVVCGRAEKTDGTPLSNVRINISYSTDNELLGTAITDGNGEYCITLPEINTNRRFEVYVQYDNGTSEDNYLALASNDYTLDFDDDLVYSRGSTSYIPLTGEIRNENAEVENGRFEVNVKYKNGDEWEEILDYQKYSIDIEPNEIYSLPEDGLNFSWRIPSDAKTGEYKFYVKTSFNAKDHTKDVPFNITA